ncbi:TRAP transporter substrate-binding protein DctP [Thiohalobacter sp. IOR34]|uniref:TRAP transporter substrate-binding protein n=1 Tax=Thiohalobacter sp. IOR34 TaxID=3057176 RepID=UPI0025B00F85|nr:TRAP transporter substrate-binding protein DctP [Thiohalobacter sp. IOR34]WJW76554.1 TRAP transporter substrate-binding protein DctP [Thiohalobacter sp. IOR34]
MKRLFTTTLLLLGLLFGPAAGAGPRYVLKFATLAPPGSTWMNLLEDWGEAVKVRSEGRLVFKFYPGGVQGDEPDVLKKIRFNQLQGAALTGYGMGRIYSPARVLELPFLFNDYAEIDFVREHFMPEFEQGFRDHGYELLGWMEVGFVYFFSKQPIHSFDDLKQQRIWLWQGDPLGEALFRASGLAPVPLSITDVFTSLSTGLLDTVYCTPLAAIALQWFTKVGYVTELPMANGIGGLLVSRRFFDRLPPDLQQILRDTGREASRELIRATRVDNAKSIEVLKEEGLEFMFGPEDLDPAELVAMRDKAAQELTRQNYIPAELLQRTRRLLHEFRSSRAGAASGSGGE